MSTSITYYSSPIGVLSIQSLDNSISSILFADTIKDIKLASFELNNFTPDVIKNCITQLNEYFAGTRTTFTISTLQYGTTFQQNVWAQLGKIPYAKTISYLELSKQMGNAKSIRAVGAANAKNQLSILVPCHRVIGSKGNLVGYSGQLWRKKWLLQHENHCAYGTQTLF